VKNTVIGPWGSKGAGEHAGRGPLRRGSLAHRETVLGQRHRDTRDRVDHEQHLLALVAEVFRNRGRDEGTTRAHERGLVAGRDDEDGARQPLGA